MNFLELVQRLSSEAGQPGSGPSAVTAQTGMNLRMVNWTISAWKDIQVERPDWKFMKGDFSFPTVANQAQYTPAEAGISSRFGRWNLDSVKLYLTNVNDETLLGKLSYERWRSIYLVGQRTPGRPVNVAQAPDDRLALGYYPDRVYTVGGEYQKTVQVLAADDDEPELPSEYHDLIWYRALMKYARYAAAGEIYDDAKTESRRLMSALVADQTPEVTYPEPLV